MPGSRDRPNVVFVCSDQHSFRYAGYAGHDHVETPNLDRIADRGVVFENAYCASPVCTPSRASMMTGTYPSDCDSFCNATVWDGSHPTWGTRLREAGYHTWATGKLELDPDHEIGFEEVDTSHGHCNNPDITTLFRRPVAYRVGQREAVDGHPRTERHSDAEVAANAEAFIETSAPELREPWAAYAGFLQPHPPFVALEEQFDRYYPDRVDLPEVPQAQYDDEHLMVEELRRFNRVDKPIPDERVRRARAGYYGMITELDEYVGRLWDALDRTGQLENTVFVYTSDHGEMLGEHGLWHKNVLYEDAAHVPLIVAGGDLPAGVRVETPVGHVDLVRTMMEWAGVEPPEEMRGHSLRPLIDGDTGDHPGYAYSESHGQGNCTGSFMIRRGDWKYIHFTWYDDLLFDLAEDPDELDNRIDDPDAAEVREELREILHREVDPEAVTRRAFSTQEALLSEMSDGMTESGLRETLESRMGPGLAQVLAARYAGADDPR